MKPTLVLGLGNRLMGDDGIACRVTDRLASDQAVLTKADVIAGVTDVLRLADQFKGRRRIIVIDAVLGNAQPGKVSVVDPRRLQESAPTRRHAHGISPVDNLELLRAVDVLEPRTVLKVVTISIGSVRGGEELSPALSEALPAITDSARNLIVEDA